MIVHPFLRPDGPLPAPVGSVEVPGVPIFARGKVREIYDLGDRLLLVSSDRLSAFDVVMREPVPGKGIVLTALSEYWFELTRGIVPNHLISTDVRELPSAFQPYAEQLAGRAMLVRKARRIDFECVVRGYLAGSAWEEYRGVGSVAGHLLPWGLRQSERLREPIFTPATKATSGHDENITISAMAERLGEELTRHLEAISLALYRFAEAHARARGLILADTKFEFGLLDDQVLLIDELLTPDSSRFWPADGYEPGRAQPSFDKQFVRDYLIATGWNREPPPPPLPPEVVEGTARRYREAYLRLTGPVLSGGV